MNNELNKWIANGWKEGKLGSGQKYGRSLVTSGVLLIFENLDFKIDCTGTCINFHAASEQKSNDVNNYSGFRLRRPPQASQNWSL